MEIVMFKVNSSHCGRTALPSILHTHMLMSYTHTHTHSPTPEPAVVSVCKTQLIADDSILLFKCCPLAGQIFATTRRHSWALPLLTEASRELLGFSSHVKTSEVVKIWELQLSCGF